MKFIQEFKEFALKGNVVDMAIGIMIGAAFGKITTSLVNDVLMPPLGVLIGGVDFSTLKIDLPTLHGDAPVSINYGLFVNTIIDFTITAFALFLFIKLINRMRKKEAAAEATPTKQESLLIEIRDLLKKASMK